MTLNDIAADLSRAKQVAEELDAEFRAASIRMEELQERVSEAWESYYMLRSQLLKAAGADE